MDPKYTGTQIASARKMRGLTQKQLAEQLMVTDKAVSKWERGINYPDIALLKPLSETLDVSVLTILGVEEIQIGEAVEVAAISMFGKEKLKRELRWRWLLSLIVSFALMGVQIFLSYIFSKAEMFGLPMALTIGLLPLHGLLIANALYSLLILRRS